MIRRIGITGIVSVAAFVLSAVAATSASANLPLKCYEVSEFKAGTQAGNWKNAACTEEVTKLTGQWAEAELVTFVEKSLWCAKLTPYAGNSETGTWATNKCKIEGGKKSNGEYIEVNVPEETKLLPEPTTANPITDVANQSEKGHLLSNTGLEVKCEKGVGSESWTSANLASAAHVLFTECKAALESVCTGEGEPAGLIAALGEAHFWLGLLMMGTKGNQTSELISALVFLTKEIKFKCENESGSVKEAVVVKPGCTAAEDLPASLNKLVSEVKEEFTEWAPKETKGESGILSVLPAGATSEIPCLLHLTVNGGAEQLAAITAKFAMTNYKHSEGTLTIELMDL
jgi:hypothetical protein